MEQCTQLIRRGLILGSPEVPQLLHSTSREVRVVACSHTRQETPLLQLRSNPATRGGLLKDASWGAARLKAEE